MGLVGSSSPSFTILGESLQCCVGGAAGILQDLVNIFQPRSAPSVFFLHSTFEDRLDQPLVSYEVTDPDVVNLRGQYSEWMQAEEQGAGVYEDCSTKTENDFFFVKCLVV
jgi:hypothetical protein